jgi:hypothetical protein
MAPFLVTNIVANPLKYPYELSTGDNRKLAHTAT